MLIAHQEIVMIIVEEIEKVEEEDVHLSVVNFIKE
jgi:hypothetical protein